MILLDTSVLIDYPKVHLPEGDLAFSAISYAELSFAGYAELAARVHARRPSHSRSKDVMLAGQALSLGAAFATQNPKDFELVADLVQIVVPDRR